MRRMLASAAPSSGCGNLGVHDCGSLGVLLQSIRRRHRKRVAVVRVPITASTGPNMRWSMDFVSDALADGRKIRALTIVDAHTRECPTIEVGHSLPGARVVQVLDRLRVTRGLPTTIVCDNGPEFRGEALDQWASLRQVTLQFIELGKPVQNAFSESLNGRFRDECLNERWFVSLQGARETIEAWRVDYNEVRPHSGLADATPTAFALSLSGTTLL